MKRTGSLAHDKVFNAHESRTESKESKKPVDKDDHVRGQIWAAAAPCAGKPVSWIHGVDEYSYRFGTSTAQRAEKRRSTCGPPSPVRGDGGSSTNSILNRPVSAPQKKTHDYAQMVKMSSWAAASWAKTIKATTEGAIFWNTDAPPADTSAFLVLKRRQKLENDVLKEIVVSYGTTYNEVLSLFKVFEFYADDVDNPVLPTVAVQNHKHHEGHRKKQKYESITEEGQNELFQQYGDSSLTFGKLNMISKAAVRFKENKKNKERRFATDNAQGYKVSLDPRFEGTDNNKIWDALIGRYKVQEVDEKSRTKFRDPCTSPGGGHSPQSVQAEAFSRIQGRACNVDVDPKLLQALQSKSFDEALWESTKHDLSRRTFHGHARKTKSMRATFDGVLHRMLEQDDEEHENHKDHDPEMHDVHKHPFLATECPEAVVLRQVSSVVSKWPPGKKKMLRQNGKSNLKEGLAALLDGTTDNSTDFEQRRAFLQASSNAIMTCNILRKAEEGGEKTAVKSRREVLAERTKILQGISLPEMSKENLFTVLSHFGTVDKRSVDEIFTCLVDSTESKAADADAERGLPFQAFWCLIQAVPAPTLDTKGTTAADAGTYFDLEMLRKLVFQIFAEPPKGSKSIELASVDIIATLRRLLCTSVLHDVDHSSGAATRSERGTLHGSPMALHGSPVSIQAESPVHSRNSQNLDPISHRALKLLGECLHMWFTHQELRKRHNHLGICDQSAIDKFAGSWPNAFVCLFRLIFPLAPQGREFIQADMELAQKGLFHRRGEIDAKMNTLINHNQRDMLKRIWECFVQPQLAVKARRLERMASREETKMLGARE